MPAVAHRGAEYAVAVARPKRSKARGLAGLTSETAAEEFIPEPIRLNENQVVPNSILPLWSGIVAPKYGPATAAPAK